METDLSKILGVYIDKKLTWKTNISNIAGKIARGIGIRIKARKYFTHECMITLYYSFVFTYLIYCNRKWQDYVYIQCEYKSTKQKIKHLLREENKVKENKIS